ncbi:MAG: VCBS repeat-containing protein [Gemmataceae bacterium]
MYDDSGAELYRVASPYGDGVAVRTALADVTGDGTADLITAPGSGAAPTVNVYDGADPGHALVASFSAFEASFAGGVYVAAADITGDGFAEIVVGADLGGGPRAVVFDGSTVGGDATPTALADFLAIDDSNFRGGIRLALGDISGDGVADLVVSAGFGGGPRVAAYDGASLAQGQTVKLFADFFAFEGTLRNGAYVSVGDVNGDGCGDLVFGAGPGGGPRVRALDGRAAMDGTETELASFFAGDPGSRQGVEPGVVTNADGTTSIVGTDVATGETRAFAPNGRGRGRLGGHHGGLGAPPFEGSSLTAADAAVVESALTAATFDGTGTGTLSTLSTTPGGAPTSDDADVTVSVDIDTATTTATGDAPLRLLNVTGTVTVTVGDAAPVRYAFTGTFSVAGGTADAPRGRLTIRATPTGSATGFTLNGVVAEDTLTVSWLVVSDHSTGSGGSVFQVRGVRGTDPLTLTQA